MQSCAVRVFWLASKDAQAAGLDERPQRVHCCSSQISHLLMLWDHLPPET